MEDSVLRLLEHTAIRYSTGMDYKVWRELESTGEFCNRLPVLSDLELIRKSGSFNGLSERSRILTDDAVSSSVSGNDKGRDYQAYPGRLL